MLHLLWLALRRRRRYCLVQCDACKHWDDLPHTRWAEERPRCWYAVCRTCRSKPGWQEAWRKREHQRRWEDVQRVMAARDPDAGR